jgi:hypothetical protein
MSWLGGSYMGLDNITITKLDDHDIVLPELAEIYYA